MRGGCVIGLLLAAGVPLAGCTDRNPRYHLAVAVDGAAGTGGGGGGAGGGNVDPPESDGQPSADGATPDEAQAHDTEPPPDLGPSPEAPAYLDGPLVLLDAADAPPDLPPDRTIDLPPDAFVPPAGCGTVVTNVSGVGNADGVVVDSDGTIYTLTTDSTHSYVGRIAPGGTPDVKWLRVDNSPTTWGLALDSAGERLFVLVVDGPGALVRFGNYKSTPVGDTLYNTIDNGNDAVVGPDRAVYYTQQGDRHVYAVDQNKVRRRVTTTPMGPSGQDPAALGFDPGGNLLVGVEEGPLYRLTLVNGVETARVALTGWSGWVNGIAHDRRGRLYVATYHDSQNREVVRLDLSGNAITGATTIATGGRFSSIAFGRGALDCRDLYITDPWSFMRRVRVADSL